MYYNNFINFFEYSFSVKILKMFVLYLGNLFFKLFYDLFFIINFNILFIIILLNLFVLLFIFLNKNPKLLKSLLYLYLSIFYILTFKLFNEIITFNILDFKYILDYNWIYLYDFKLKFGIDSISILFIFLTSFLI